jgi:hypothetical protein
MSGFRVPYKNRVTWKLDKGNFTWLELELTSLEYDSKEFF